MIPSPIAETHAHPQDAALLSRARQVMPGGVYGFHKLFANDRFPSFMAKGEGAYVYDVDGNEYVDYVLGKGPLILGYRHPAVQQAVHAQIDAGNLLSLSPVAQVDVAERLLGFFPSADLARFHKTGSEACQAAVRLARVLTGKTWILSSGYHGWHDWCSPQSRGVPPQTVAFEDFGYDLARAEHLLEIHAGDVAALFVEPQPSLLSRTFYQRLRRLADAASCLLLFDEVKTGLRMVGGGVQQSLGVVPDASVVSKALANGYCLSAVLGRADVLEASEQTHISTTYDIEATPFAAARATLSTLRTEDVAAHLDQVGEALITGFNELFRSHDVPAKAFAPGCMFRLGFAEAARETFFYNGMVQQGVLLYPYDNHFVSLAHGPAEVARTLDAADRVLRQSVEAHPRACAWQDVAPWPISAFQNRKGFLQGVPGPDG